LSVNNLTIGYETQKGMLKAVDNISFELEKGSPLGFVGESGCGKTTIGMALMGLLPDNAVILQGSILFQGKDLVTLTESQWQKVRGAKIAMIFQAAMNALNPVFRVDEQIREAIVTHQPDISEKELSARLKTLFDLVDIPAQRMTDYPHEYSGGMKQRAVIAMALACDPDLIVADEPTTALDVIVQDQILREIMAVQQQTHAGLIFISHDIAVVASVCDQICVMYAGQIVETGTRKEVFKSPRHPYTRSLLGSYLSLDNLNDIRIPKMQETPDLVSDIRSCRFAASCSACTRACADSVPGWIDISPTHRALCCEPEVIRKDYGKH
ncbi:MAG: ABC transporter ATP-binding protein, partial [Desulfotignum sp.]